MIPTMMKSTICNKPPSNEFVAKIPFKTIGTVHGTATPHTRRLFVGEREISSAPFGEEQQNPPQNCFSLRGFIISF